MKLKNITIVLAASLLAALGLGPVSATPMSLQEAAQKAVSNNPEVLARFHTFTSTVSEQDVARGGYFPSLDLSASTGKERYKGPTDTSYSSYNSHGTSLVLRQLLYDGFATSSEVRRLGHAKLTRLYEFFDASETAALEAARAFYDVQRYRRLLELAQENYVSHRSVFEQIQRRVQAGVGRRVDLEQAAGRLALSESNLLTEAANLHDVSARFQRVVGEAPAAELAAPRELGALPATGNDLLRVAQARSPMLLAAVENVRASQAEMDVQRGAYHPTLALRLRQDMNTNLNGLLGDRDTRVAEVALNWNLFKGGSDVARVRQYADRLNAAKDLRDKACRDVRQVVAIAANDTQKLAEQLRYLDQHQLSIEKAREAYQKQFDIGQRSLLDLLDTENELFQARRAYTNADYDLAIAYARAHAGVGNLLAVLDVSKREPGEVPELGDTSQDDAAVSNACPPEAPAMVVLDKKALTEQALARMQASAHVAPAAPVVAPAPTTDQVIRERISAWAAAWSAKNVEAYTAFYAPTFVPDQGLSRDAWVQQRKQRLSKAGSISVTVENPAVAVTKPDRATATFRQIYTSADYQDVASKTLEWVRVDGKWLIERELAAPTR
jgi:adhesin transport system outer membrane protein